MRQTPTSCNGDDLIESLIPPATLMLRRTGIDAENHIPLHVKDGWAPVMSVAIHARKNFEAIFACMEGLVDPAIDDATRAAYDEHNRFVDFLERKVPNVHTVGCETKPGCRFVRDAGFVYGNQLFRNGRDDLDLHAVTSRVENHLSFENKAVRRYGPDGGDVLVTERAILMGHRGDNEMAVRNIREIQSHFAMQLNTPVVPVTHQHLHLDHCLAPLPNGGALISAKKPGAYSKPKLTPYLPKSTQQLLVDHFDPIVKVPYKEARMLALNLWWLNPKEVVSQPRCVETNKLLGSMGYQVHTLPFDENARRRGAFHCITFDLERAPE